MCTIFLFVLFVSSNKQFHFLFCSSNKITEFHPAYEYDTVAMFKERQKIENEFDRKIREKLAHQEFKQIDQNEMRVIDDEIHKQTTGIERKREITDELKAISKKLKQFSKTERLVCTTDIYINQLNFTNDEVKHI